MSDDINQEQQNITDLEEQLAEARAEAEKNLNGWKRAQADLINFQNVQEKKNAELIEFAREVAVAKLLPSLDSLEQALRHAPEESEELRSKNEDFATKYKDWLNGISGITKQLDKALSELGVEKIEAVGKKFDPNFHEALREIEGQGESGMVVEEYQTGYMINGKVVRPSQVGISKDQNKE